MNSLAKFQVDFINASLFNNEQAIGSLKHTLRKTPQLTTNAQISIYTNSINSGLVNTLSNIYPVCEKLVGEKFFHKMALDYMKSHPSLSPDLANYGADFSPYLSSSNAINSVPYLSDVAKLEWSYHRAFHCQDEAEFDSEILSTYTAEQLTSCIFSLPRSHELIKSNYPVDEIWRMNHSENEDELILDENYFYLYLYRKQHNIHLDKISKSEFKFLQSINKQQSFLEVCEKMPVNMDISALLVKSLQHGWINRVQVPA